KVTVLYGLAVINAVGNGLISIVGWGGAYTADGRANSKALIAGAGGATNSGAVGVAYISIKRPECPEEPVLWEPVEDPVFPRRNSNRSSLNHHIPSVSGNPVMLHAHSDNAHVDTDEHHMHRNTSELAINSALP